MKVLFLLLTLISTQLFGMTKRLDSSQVILILNMEDSPTLPRNFRIDRLYSSGSGQFSQQSLTTLLSQIPSNKILIVDLREESHGFINGHAMSWYADMNLGNLDKTTSEILLDEFHRLELAAQQKTVEYLRNDLPDLLLMDVHSYSTEETLACENHVGYIRLPCTDHRRPSDAIVDEFVTLMHSKPSDTWYHFHCSAGKGRTTTFMIMQDIFLNAKEVSFEDILDHQKLIGGKDMQHLPSTDSWKYDSLVDRVDFLKEFYTYCQTATENISWTQWLLDKN